MFVHPPHQNGSPHVSYHSLSALSRVQVLNASTVCCFQTIIMSDCIIRGDLANVRIGRHCIISNRAVIRPPFKKFHKGYGIRLPFRAVLFSPTHRCSLLQGGGIVWCSSLSAASADFVLLIVYTCLALSMSYLVL